uniref:Uncharacterized protein n=1 Tax=Glossina morsitans morsitans TaxID=37546 RepID=A0A1B0G3K9_GLOMM
MQPCAVKSAKTYLETVICEVSSHPLYSPNIAKYASSSKYHLLRRMSHGIVEQIFDSYKEADVDYWIASKELARFLPEIQMLLERA